MDFNKIENHLKKKIANKSRHQYKYTKDFRKAFNCFYRGEGLLENSKSLLNTFSSINSLLILNILQIHLNLTKTK